MAKFEKHVPIAGISDLLVASSKAWDAATNGYPVGEIDTRCAGHAVAIAQTALDTMRHYSGLESSSH